jgi:hypothetical protein
MKENVIFRLMLLLALNLLFNSCRNEDLSHESKSLEYSMSSKNDYHKLSPWDEDEAFIKTAQKIFLNNVDYKYFSTKYGEVNWNYAMSFGNFDSSYLVVPIIKNNSTVHVMKVIRKDNKIFFYEKQDRTFIEFFNNIILNKNFNIKEEIIYKNSESSKALIFKCVYRTITVGCPPGYSNCEPVSNMVSECNWQEEGGVGNPTQMEFCNPLECDGGGSGGFDLPDIVVNQDIINNLQDYPCAQSIVQQLPNLQNDLATAMRQIFQNNDNYNIIFRPKSNMGNVDGTTFSSHTNTGAFTAIINLNDQILTNATKEFILVTMYHEVIHAFLDYEKFRLGDTAFQEQYPGVIIGYDYTADGTIVNRYTYIEGHQQLIPFLATLESILSAYNPNLPHNVIVAMARTGITTTTQEQKQLNSNEKNTTLGNYNGTKCP